ncbi:zinc finger protein 91-like [Pieris napi]|uniref:zinc finger protein 91-like n=1 Tax=Pieris napi TaxID=78633 RepID=UPI001FBA221B|nr:zinc finger protein 91-like [Pieris napi]XP_047523097.1 zinc finger protein 91-like [Pieris napi]
MPKVKKKSAKSRTHKCPKCEKKFSDSSGLNRHLELHVEDRLHGCTVCKATFKTKRYLSRHRKRVHSEPEEHECKDCGKKFHFKSSLNQHRLVHTDERPHKCKWCNKGFNSTYSLSSHILIHENSKPFKCTFCDYACRDSSTLRKHKKRHIGQVPTYNCKICEKKFSQKRLLEFHVAKEHLNIDVNVLPCDKCGKMFRDKASLKLHIQKIHKRLYAAKCPVCSVTISCKQNMEAHLRSHLDERPFCCTFEGCGKAFKDARALYLHEFLHYPERYLKCKLCDKRFSRQSRLDSHKKQHFLVKEKYVVCDYCNVRFYSKNYLINHIAKHLYKNKYICDICNKEFCTKPSLIGHIIAHNSETDKQCKLCKKSFKKHIYLKSHYWNTHCIKYKITRKNVKIKRTQMVPEIKTEAAEKFVIKSEPLSDTDEETEYSKSVLAEDLKASGNQMNIFYDIKTMDRNKIHKINDPRINKELKETVKIKIKRLLQKVQTLKERCDLERARRRYNKRMENLLKREEPQTELTKTEVGKITFERDENGKLKFNVHQCYVCFTLYKTKEELLDHCQQHFDLCHTNTLRKCPLCDHVSSLTLSRHLLRKHKIKTKLYTGNIKNDGSQFYYDVNGKAINKLEVIPSVKLLNRQAYIDLDRTNRDKKDKIIAKTKLVKKGTEWIVEKEKLNIENFKIPKLCEIDSSMNFGDDHCARMKSLSVATKLNGGKMLYPCDRCEKICQTLSALKLHYRRHDPNAKPFKPKVWKHKLKNNDKNTNNRNNIVCDVTKRYVKPKPITNKHRCDPELIKFYESNITGDNIEFWQFLKIYNRMTRENIKDFSDLKNRTDFGIQPVSDVTSGTDNCNYKITKDVGKKKRKPQLKVLRHILISKKEYKKRNEIKARLRQSLVVKSIIS